MNKNIYENLIVLLVLLSLFLITSSFYTIKQQHEFNSRISKLELSQNNLYKIYNTTNIVGKVVDKYSVGDKYTIVIAGYGKFLVDKDVYDEATIGEHMPKYIEELTEKLQSVGG